MIKRNQRSISTLLILIILLNCFTYNISYGVTSGPQQPEFSSFSQANNTDMVDLFTGNFNYNIPLLEIPGINGGYPVNLFYKSPTSMEEEATVVGFGWNLGIGAINREVDGIPDDFNNIELREKIDMKKDWTVSYNIHSNIETFGADLDKLSLNPGLGSGLTFSYNNILGLGLGRSRSINLAFGNLIRSDLSLNSSTLDAPSWNSSVSLSGKNKSLFSYGYSKSVLSPRGVTSLLFGTTLDKNQKWPLNYSLRITSPLTYPSYDYNLQGGSLKVGIKSGLEASGVTATIQSSGIYQENILQNKDQWVKRHLYGSMYLDKISSKNNKDDILDFNTENKILIRNNQLNLSIPFSKPDQFLVSGQGMNGFFSLFRGDVGVYHDKPTNTKTNGSDVSFEIAGAGIAKYGVDVTYLYSRYNSNYKNASILNDLNIGFKSNKNFSKFEPFCFKFENEKTAELVNTPSNTEAFINRQSYSFMGYDHPVSISKSSFTNKTLFGKHLNLYPHLVANYIDEHRSPLSNITDGKRTYRIPRKRNIEYYCNRDLIADNINTLKEFDISFRGVKFLPQGAFIIDSFYTPINRTYGKDKLSAFTIVNTNGDRWNYGLPVINYIQKDVSFSLYDEVAARGCKKVSDNFVKSNGNNRTIDYKMSKKNIYGSTDYLDIKETPSFAKSFLITSITGADYVDVNDNGVDFVDKGKWFKFNYLRISNDSVRYNWRAPFSGVSYQKGSNSYKHDDRGHFKYGERDLYHIHEIVSSTHKAVFYYSLRGDNLGVESWLNKADDPILAGKSAFPLKLDSIVLFSHNHNPAGKLTKIKKIGFCYYSNGAWPNSPNSTLPNKGRLMLKNVWFENYKSIRGAFNPYSFEYFDFDNSGPKYSTDQLIQDRWGIYYPYGNDCYAIHAPYTPQFDPSLSQKQFRANIDKYARAYHLSSITLPSGSKINVELERDDYSMFGNHIAGQMFKIAGFKDPDGPDHTDLDMIPIHGNEQDNIKVYFRLEHNIDENDPNKDLKLSRYFEDLYEDAIGKQIFFKLNSYILGPVKENNVEYVTGYGHLDHFGFGSPVSGKHRYAYFVMKRIKPTIKGIRYHPFLVASWLTLKDIYKSLLYNYHYKDPQTIEEKIKAVWAVITTFDTFLNIIKGYFGQCISKERGAKIKLDESFVRLKTPDQVKYGGNLRVKKIYVSNVNGNLFDSSPQYGKVYDYTTTRTITGNSGSFIDTISSGVALNEPYIGSEENANKYIKEFEDHLIHSAERLRFQEYPIYQSILPPPNVGYSKVTVKSLVSDYNLRRSRGENVSGLYGFPNNLLTELSSTGKTVYEFYTTKDFPYIFEQTTLHEGVMSPKNWIIPLIGSLGYFKYCGTQGYHIETNDMSGRLKSVISYGQKKSGSFADVPIRSIKYFYSSKKEAYNEGSRRKTRRRLQNITPVLANVFENKSIPDSSAIIRKAEVGVTRQFYSYLHHSTSKGGNPGVDLNFDVLPFPPSAIPSGWPNVHLDNTELNTFVMNKITKKTGILSKIVRTDEQSSVTESNLFYDSFNGKASLTSMENEFDDKIYTLNIPAHFKYYPMKPAYFNWNYHYKYPNDLHSWSNTPLITEYNTPYNDVESNIYYFHTQHNSAQHLFRVGDIIRTRVHTSNLGWISYRGEVLKRGTTLTVVIHGNSIPISQVDSVDLKILKSAYKNKLDANILSIRALNNPTKDFINTTEQVLQYPDSIVNVTMINGVIDATATLYSEYWDSYPYKKLKKGPHFLKTRGNCRLKSKYMYSSNRVYDGLPIRKQGVIDSVPFFLPDYEHLYTKSLEKWIPINEIKSMNESGMVTSEADIINNTVSLIDNYFTINPTTSESQGGTIYNSIVPEGITAKATNATLYEIAFTSFEDYEVNDASKRLNNLKSKRVENRSHFNYLPIVEKDTSVEVFNVIKKFGSRINSSSHFIIDMDYLGYDDPKYIGIETYSVYNATSTGNQEYYPVLLSSNPVSNLNFGVYRNRELVDIHGMSDSKISHFSSIKEEKVGLISASRADNSQLLGKIYITDTLAHTGKSALVLKSFASNDSLTLNQSCLRLHKGKTYYFSCWINEPSYYNGTTQSNRDAIPDINLSGVAIKILNGPNHYTKLVPKGSRIDGWQKVEGKFEYNLNSSDFDIRIKLGNLNRLYIDDLRIHPIDSKFESYVYDFDKRRMTEMLDNNNYFTRFKYNEDGDLIVIEKESEKGILGVQNQVKHLKRFSAPYCSSGYSGPEQ